MPLNLICVSPEILSQEPRAFATSPWLPLTRYVRRWRVSFPDGARQSRPNWAEVNKAQGKEPQGPRGAWTSGQARGPTGLHLVRFPTAGPEGGGRRALPRSSHHLQDFPSDLRPSPGPPSVSAHAQSLCPYFGTSPGSHVPGCLSPPGPPSLAPSSVRDPSPFLCHCFPPSPSDCWHPRPIRFVDSQSLVFLNY